MKRISIVIEKSEDIFWAYSENFPGINGVGNTIQKVKQSVLECIDIQKEIGNFQKVVRGKYEVIFSEMGSSK